MTTQSLKKQSFKDIPKLKFSEEVWNSVTHGLMALALLIIYPYVSIKAYADGGLVFVIGTSVFIISLFMMFMGSTLYHAMAYGSKHKLIFRKLDHIFIFFAIAGTYTPIALTVIGGWLGWTVVLIQWAVVLFGTLQKALVQKANPKVSLTLYLVMGWVAVLLLPKLIMTTSPLFVGLIALGGVLYSIGAWFYAQKGKPYFHTIWHVFINLAAISHFIAIVFFMV